MPHARGRAKRAVQIPHGKVDFSSLYFCASLHSNGSNLDQTKSQISMISQYCGSYRSVDLPSHLRHHKFIFFADESIYAVRITSRPNAPPPPGTHNDELPPLISGGGERGGRCQNSLIHKQKHTILRQVKHNNNKVFRACLYRTILANVVGSPSIILVRSTLPSAFEWKSGCGWPSPTNLFIGPA